MIHRAAIGLAVVVGLATLVHAQTILYVDGDSLNDGPGNDWGHAYHCLQDALRVALASDEIRIAKGVHRPDQSAGNPIGTGDREATFQLTSGVTILGGYAGYGAIDPDERDLAQYETILSGDIGTAVYSADNSYHVVTASGTSATTLLEGVTVVAGYADGPAPFDSGGGMYLVGGDPVLSHCRFHHNQAPAPASFGGAMYMEYAAPTITDCVFTENMATASGGAIARLHDGSLALLRCEFSGNFAAGMGGALYVYGGESITATDCTFLDNMGLDLGGAVCIESVAESALTRCAFVANSAVVGSGVLMAYGRSSLDACRFVGNRTPFLFSDPDYGGGGLSTWEHDALVTNCTFSGNEVGGAAPGGAIHNVHSTLTLSGCTFAGNVSRRGGAIANAQDSTLVADNCILWGNIDSDGAQIVDDSATASVTYSCIEGGLPGEGNVSQDPLLVDPNGADDVPGTNDDDLHLSRGSPCINAGDNAAIPEAVTTDLEGHARVLCVTVDMGAHEFGIGDIDCSQAIDLSDFAEWDACMVGPGADPYPDRCEAFDFEFDGDVDIQDLGAFQLSFGGL